MWHIVLRSVCNSSLTPPRALWEPLYSSHFPNGKTEISVICPDQATSRAGKQTQAMWLWHTTSCLSHSRKGLVLTSPKGNLLQPSFSHRKAKSHSSIWHPGQRQCSQIFIILKPTHACLGFIKRAVPPLSYCSFSFYSLNKSICSVVPGTEPRASCMLSRAPQLWATSPVPYCSL